MSTIIKQPAQILYAPGILSIQRECANNTLMCHFAATLGRLQISSNYTLKDPKYDQYPPNFLLGAFTEHSEYTPNTLEIQ